MTQSSSERHEFRGAIGRDDSCVTDVGLGACGQPRDAEIHQLSSEGVELKPCPFCGGKAGVAQTDKGVELGLPAGIFVLACRDCETGWSNTNLEKLVTKWNTRSEESLK